MAEVDDSEPTGDRALVARVRVVGDPERDLLARVADLLDRSGTEDASPPLNEAALLALKHPDRPDTRHLVAVVEDEPVGYAQLASDGTGQLVVDPRLRRHGIGRLLMESLLDAAQLQEVQLRVWALGNSPAARALAARTGLAPTRTLLIMRRPLADLPAPAVPDGITIAPFRVGVDEQAWLTVNARAFAHHPEQGSIDADDLAERMGEAWFDPAGFFLARGSASDGEGNPAGGVGSRPPSGSQGSASASEGNPAGGVGGRPPSGSQGSASASEGNPAGGVGGRPPSGQSRDVLGFHWTKQHDVLGEPGLGEVYVLGVDPSAQGRGLAKALLLTGLAHLRTSGDTEVELYVEEDQPGPVGLYRSYGFTEASRDVMYAGPTPEEAR